MKGFGTDEKLLIRTLASKDPLQIEALRAAFQRQFSRDLVHDIEKETSGNLEYGLLAVARGPLLTDVYTLRDSLKGLGTNEVLLNDVLLSRSNADIQAIKSTYYKTFSRRLEDDVKSDLSGKTERHFLMVLAGNRAEDSAPVVPQQVEQDVLEIYKASEGRMGTDELLICSIFTSRNDNQLRAIAHAYQQRYSKSLEQVIKSVGPTPPPPFASPFQEHRHLNPHANARLYRNFPATWRMHFYTNYAMLMTSICTPLPSSRQPWPAPAQEISSSPRAWSATTGTATR